MKERTIVYPYNVDFFPILNHSCLLDALDIVGVVSPNGWGLTGKDAGNIGGIKDTGITIKKDFKNMLKTCDTVLFIENYDKLDSKEFIYPKILEAINENKNIICTINLESAIKNDIAEKCKAKGVNFKYYNNLNNDLSNVNTYSEDIKEINTPVIFVLGFCDRTNKFELQLALREEFMKKGYKVSQIGSRNYCEMLHFHSFPSFMYSNKFSESQKIKLFNEYVSEIEAHENPDLIIIGIPGGIAPINKIATNNFGIFAYEVSQAVTPDASVLSLIYASYSAKDIEFIKNSVKYKLGFDVNCLNISNSTIDWLELKESHTLSFIAADSNSADDKKMEVSKSFSNTYNILDKLDAQNLAEAFINTLSENENAQYV